MIDVCIWLAEGENIGHAGMCVGASAESGSGTYISWWPEYVRVDDDGKVEQGDPPSEKGAVVGRAGPFRNKSFASDKRDEGRAPHQHVYLRGLNEKRILQWWKGFGLVGTFVTRSGRKKQVLLQGPLPPWQLLTQNCSTVVATALKEGGGDSYASWAKSWSVVWRPQTVLDFALSIAEGLGTSQQASVGSGARPSPGRART